MTAAAQKQWWIMKATAFGHELPPFYGTQEEADAERDAHADRTHGVVRMEPADPKNRTHIERVEKELETRKALRARGHAGYDELPALTQA